MQLFICPGALFGYPRGLPASAGVTNAVRAAMRASIVAMMAPEGVDGAWVPDAEAIRIAERIEAALFEGANTAAR